MGVAARLIPLTKASLDSSGCLSIDAHYGLRSICESAYT